MKRTIKLIACVFLLVGCSKPNTKQKVEQKSQKGYETHSYLGEYETDKLQPGRMSVICYAYQYTPELLLREADAIVIASIVSLDGYINIDSNNPMKQTYGKLLIRNSLYGKIKESTLLDYTRGGAIFKEEEQYYLDAEDGDINLEAGKTYLMYIMQDKGTNKNIIFGFEIGTREVNVDQVNTVYNDVLDLKSLKILNNHTGEYESLQNYIDNYIL